MLNSTLQNDRSSLMLNNANTDFASLPPAINLNIKEHTANASHELLDGLEHRRYI